MSERPRGDNADPDATVFDSADAHKAPKGPVPASPDPDATVFHPGGSARPQGTETAVTRRPAPAGGSQAHDVDPDPTMSLPELAREPAVPPVRAPRPGPDPDATVADAGGSPAPPEAPATPVRQGRDPEATLSIPTPGKRRDTVAPAVEREVATADLSALGGLNPLVAAANTVLGAVPQIRHALWHPNSGALRVRLQGQIGPFEKAARAAGVGDEVVGMARHALCSLLDDAASATPWGGDWIRHGVLSAVEGKSADGGWFFTQLDNLAEDPSADPDLLEFFYVCLALGYEGRYRNTANGREQIAQLRQRIHERIRTRRAAEAGELSPHWQGVVTRRPRVSAALALWAAGAGAALLLVAVYLGYSISLGSDSDPIAREIAQLKVKLAVEPAASRAAPPATRVSQRLADAIARGEVAVTEDARQSMIVIRSDQLFASGSARVEARVQPVIVRVAEALDGVPGSIVVTGHTDDVPIRTARFPSNWELSAERARSVEKLMAQKLGDPGRLRGEGLADSEPAVPNDSAANRARNRRVVIILRAAP